MYIYSCAPEQTFVTVQEVNGKKDQSDVTGRRTIRQIHSANNQTNNEEMQVT